MTNINTFFTYNLQAQNYNIYNDIAFTRSRTRDAKRRPKRKQKPVPRNTNPFRELTPPTDWVTMIRPSRVNPLFFQPQLDPRATKKYFGFRSDVIPDKYQLKAARSQYDGHNTIVSAPTGTGKTLIAESAIYNNLLKNKMTYYTTPLKALSWQKYLDFCRLFGDEKVAIMTGDTSNIEEKPNAKVIVMTTEIYLNMLLSHPPQQHPDKYKDLASVVFDEFHYMSDPNRGLIWEESIMFSPKHVQLLALSATASNSEQIAKWIEKLSQKKTDCVVVPPEERHVPLVYYAYTGNNHLTHLMTDKINLDKLENQLREGRLSGRAEEALAQIGIECRGKDEPEVGLSAITSLSREKVIDVSTLYNILRRQGVSDIAPNDVAALFDKDNRTFNGDRIRAKRNPKKSKSGYFPYSKLARILSEQNKLPAVFFILNKKDCNSAMLDMVNHGHNYLSEQEEEEVRKIIRKFEEKGVSVGDEYNHLKAGLQRGIATHHAGMLPACKGLVEELAKRKLVKVIFATETLSAGINLPAKTVIFSSITKKDDNSNGSGGSAVKQFTPSQFQQMAGRAGRRGIDDIGYVIIWGEDIDDFRTAFNLATYKPDRIVSKFSPSYTVLLHSLKRNPSLDGIDRFISNSFAIESLGASGEKASKEFKKQFKSLLGVLEKWKFVEKEGDDDYQVTNKGDVAVRVRGCNQILFTELLFRDTFTNIPAEELAALVSTITINSKCKESREAHTINKGINDKLAYIDTLARNIEMDQRAAGMINGEGKVTVATSIAPAVYKWAGSSTDDKEAWNNVIDELTKYQIVKTEGDFYKIVNNTVDLLKQIAGISQDLIASGDNVDKYTRLRNKAKEAVLLLSKSPIGDLPENIN